MASFRAHVSVGIALGAVNVLALIAFALVPPDWSYFALAVMAVSVGAVVPDIDSDSGIPFHVGFGSLSLLSGVLAFLFAWTYSATNSVLLIGGPILAVLFTWCVVGSIFKKFTRHRGMTHSVPAAAIFGLLLFLLASYLNFSDWHAFLLGLSLTAGYLAHLILDEVWAATNFHGTPFVPNKAFGSALKFISHYQTANVVTYTILFILLFANYLALAPLFTQLAQALSAK